MSVPAAQLTALLYTPGDRPERFAKAPACGAGGIIVDLEDAVAPAAKDRVRGEVVEFFRQHGRIGAPPFLDGIRLNSLRTAAGQADLAAVAAAGLVPDVVMLPKVESPDEVRLAASRLPEAVRFICLIETVRGVRCAPEIAAASSRLAALAFGGLDLSAETGGEPGWDALLWPRVQMVHACAAAGLVALDQPFIDFQDDAGLRVECERTRALGYAGKTAIHPRQCATIAAAYRPAAAELERARRIVAAFEAAAGGVVSVDGRMIDAPVYRAAARVVQRAGGTTS